MRDLLYIGLLALAMAPGTSATENGVSVSDVVRLAGRNGLAHACPIVGGLLITNHHVTEDMPIMRWSDGLGNQGTAERVRDILGVDLSILKISRGKVGKEYAIAQNAPSVGDRAYLLGYRSEGPKTVLGDRRVATKVTRVVAGHVVLEDDGKAGSSGSCVLNERGEAEAINMAGLSTDTGNERAGWAVGIWGEWASDLNVRPDVTLPDPDDGGFANTKALGQNTNALPVGQFSADRTDIIGAQLGAGVLFSSRHPVAVNSRAASIAGSLAALGVSVQHVSDSVSEKQMGRVDARRIVAAVKDKLALWYRAVSQLPRYAMSFAGFVLDREVAVSGAVTTQRPWPTDNGICAVNAIPEPIRDRAMDSHGLQFNTLYSPIGAY